MLDGTSPHPSEPDAAADPADPAVLDDLAERTGVEIVTWPDGEDRRQHLARAGVPRLLLVAPGVEAPVGVGIDEDWVRLPAERGDVVARIQRLARVIETLQHDHPVLDQRHIVHYGGVSVVLSAAQAQVMELLLAHPSQIVSRAELEAALWPAGAPGPKALDGVVFRLRRRLAGSGLVVRSAHARGFAIDAREPVVTATDRSARSGRVTGDPDHPTAV
ncbi:MAG: winged helix-turn-helix domain-containing protein [Acidimicrobiales bacterium]